MNSTDILSRLVSFRTLSLHPNLDLLSYVVNLFTDTDIEYNYIGDEHSDRKNLFLRFGPKVSGGILLSCHSDVVPVNESDWSSDPFTLTFRDEKLYGRGATDMKGFLSCCLSQLLRIDVTQLSVPIYLAISYDEEVGCLGVRSLLDWLSTQDLGISHCLVGEPTSMNLCVGHKGKVWYRVHCRGVGGHSSIAPLCINSINLAADFIKQIEVLQSELKSSSISDSAYDVPYSTFHVGRIRGGESLNVVPDYAYLDLEFRHLPADDPAHILSLLRDCSSSSIEIELLGSYPSFDSSSSVDYFSSLLPSSEVMKVPYGTEAGLFSSILGIDTIICGPGSMSQGHISDEYIDVSQLSLCDNMLSSLFSRLSI